MPETMKGANKQSALVIFGQDLPRKGKKWFKQFDEIIYQKDLEQFIKPGSIKDAFDLVNKVSRLTLADGSRISKLINWQGYELWWMNYDSIYWDFCLPYAQYADLLSYLQNFEKVYLFQPPRPDLFRYFLKAHRCQCFIFSPFRLRKLLPIPFGVFLQILLSFGFLPWLKVAKPQLMVWTSDKFAPPHDYDFRMKFIYEALRSKKTSFVEFIRSLEPWPLVLKHAWQRKRPVFYSAAISFLICSSVNLFGKKKKNKLVDSLVFSNPEEHFWLLIAVHHLRDIEGDILAIRAIKFILRWAGVKAAIINAGCNRTFHEVLACKLAGIKTVGIQHGAGSEYAFISDFMPEFDGELPLSVDRYGLWSNWWKEYYLSHSRAYKPEQLYVSGPMSPLQKSIASADSRPLKSKSLKVLFISEQLADPQEVMPYLSAILEAQDTELYFKFRPYRDGFEQWLKESQPEVYKKISEKTKILRGTIEEAIRICDVAVGSHSTAVLESLLQLKPFVFFRTNKWGDYFGIKSFDTGSWFFVDNPKDLVSYIKKSSETPKEVLKQLQERFFGNPYQNGSQWVVEQALEFAQNYAKDRK